MFHKSTDKPGHSDFTDKIGKSPLSWIENMTGTKPEHRQQHFVDCIFRMPSRVWRIE
jgi:hypothetical protein